MDQELQRILEQISMYTQQVESIDQFSITFFVTCLGFIGVVIGIVATVFSKIGIDKNDLQNQKLYKINAILTSCIPPILSMYTMVAIFNCRKVAMYRGNLIYLEKKYNTIESIAPQKYNTEILKYLSKRDRDNTEGSLMNTLVFIIIAVGIIIFISLCFYVSFHFISRIGKDNKSHKVLLILLNIILIILCITVAICAFIDLYFYSINPDDVANQLILQTTNP